MYKYCLLFLFAALFTGCTSFEPELNQRPKPYTVSMVELNYTQDYQAIKISPQGNIWAYGSQGLYKVTNNEVIKYPTDYYCHSTYRFYTHFAFLNNNVFIPNSSYFTHIINDTLINYYPFNTQNEKLVTTLDNKILVTDVYYYHEYINSEPVYTFDGETWYEVGYMLPDILSQNGNFVVFGRDGYNEIQIFNATNNTVKTHNSSVFSNNGIKISVSSNGDCYYQNNIGNNIYYYNYNTGTESIIEINLDGLTVNTLYDLASNNGKTYCIISANNMNWEIGYYLVDVNTKQYMFLDNSQYSQYYLYADKLGNAWVNIVSYYDFGFPEVKILYYNNMLLTDQYTVNNADICIYLTNDNDNNVWFSVWNQSEPYFRDLLKYNGTDFESHKNRFTINYNN